MEFSINTLKELEIARKEKTKAIEQVKNSFYIARAVAQSSLTKDILNIIKIKLNQILKQKEMPKIKELEKKLKIALKDKSSLKEKLNNEVEDILAMLTSGLNQRKRVQKVTLTNIVGSENKYIAYLANETQIEISYDNHVELAKRYLIIQEQITKLENAKNELRKNFDKEIELICKNYVKYNFEYELKELSWLAKNQYDSISNFFDNSYVDFFGNKNDFEIYKNTILEIIKINEKIQKIDNQKWGI